MKKKSITQQLCRAGVIAALYVALTYAFSPIAFGPFQFRPAEALCILPLFFPEAIPALFVGCALSNISSPYAVYDVTIGAFTTLIAAFITYLVGVFVKKEPWRFVLAGLAPVLLNAIVIPLVIVFIYEGSDASSAMYFLTAGSILLTQAVWVYGLGAALYFPLKRNKRLY